MGDNISTVLAAIAQDGKWDTDRFGFPPVPLRTLEKDGLIKYQDGRWVVIS